MQDQLAPQPLVHTLSNSARQLGGLSSATMYRLIKSGKLDALKIGDRTYITDESIRSLIADAPRLPSKKSRR